MKFKGLKLHQVSVEIEKTPILKNIEFQIPPGEIVAVLGPSGCGKSTLLQAIAGILPTSNGDIQWDAQSLQIIPIHQRGIGLMFQSHALFPHRNVEENISFGLEMSNLSSEATKARVVELLKLLNLDGYEKRNVGSLSGGESQRVALARALAPNPKLILLDEPFNSLDRSMREKLIGDIREILKSLKITAIHVTHDSEEASQIADSLLLMDRGQVIRMGSFKEMHSTPKYALIAELFGLQTMWSPVVHYEDSQSAFTTPWGVKTLSRKHRTPITALLRPEHVFISDTGVTAVIKNEILMGGETIFKCALADGFRISTKAEGTFSVGDTIHLAANVADIEILTDFDFIT